MTDFDTGTFLGRVWRPDLSGPSVVTVRSGRVLDVTSRAAPTVRDVLELEDPAAFVQVADGTDLGAVLDFLARDGSDLSMPHFLAPCDLQAVKACGVTFAGSMVERVIDGRASDRGTCSGRSSCSGVYPGAGWRGNRRQPS